MDTAAWFAAGVLVNPNETCSPGYSVRPAGLSYGWLGFGLALWAVPLVVISIMVGLRPEHRSVTPLYHEAVAHWWARQPLYEGPSGINYLPQFAIVFSPFHALPLVLCEVLWRTAAIAGLAYGLWSFGRDAKEGPKTFALLSLITMPLTLGALQNGQANAHLGVCLLLSAGFFTRQLWWPGVLMLFLAAAIKPLGFAAIGLAVAVFPGLWWRLAIAAFGFAVLPFLTGPFGYVAGQYASAFTNLRECAALNEHRFADLNGLLRTIGWPLAKAASLAVRALAGALFFAGCWRVRDQENSRRALIWYGASAAYLMLFNPMTEANSYAVLAPVLALWAWQMTKQDAVRQAQALCVMALSMGLLPELLRHWLGNSFALAWHPAMTLIFVGFLAAQTNAANNEAETPSTV